MILSIIIVNYNVKHFLENCLHSVTLAISGIETEVFIVDNHSTDGSIEYLKPRFSQFTFIQNKENNGFSKANNQALSLAVGNYILFLNPDTIVPDDCFKKCIQFMKDHPDAGALGVKMVNGVGEFLKESKRGFPSPLVSFWKMTGIIKAFPRSRYLARYYLGHLKESESHRVDVLSGAFFFVKKSVLDRTGGFDERFFMYAEDIDLSYRIVQAGFQNYYFAGTTILHFKGKSTRKDSRYVRQFYLAMSQFVKKYYGNGVYSLLLDAAIRVRAAAQSLKQGMRKRGY